MANPKGVHGSTSGDDPATVTLFQNVRIFDGIRDRLSAPSNVLLRGNTIARIATTSIEVAPRSTVIEGHGRTLMPGLIDMHWHAMLVRPTPAEALTNDVGYSNLVAGAEATDTLMRGFTSIRDLGGPAFGLKRAIDEGIVVGPRVFPCGAMIATTGGHGDFRQAFELPRTSDRPVSRMEQIGASMIADGPDEVRRRVREQLLLGASQIKLTAGGGVASPHSPLDACTFTEPELRAAVEAAENWGTYVTVHAYTPDAIQGAIRAGVACVEHGHLMDDATARLMAEKGTWLCLQPFLDDDDASPLPPGSPNRMKQLLVFTGTDTAYGLARTYALKTAFGSDILFSKSLARRQGAQLAKLVRWYQPAEALVMATGTNAALLALSGPRNPYPGKLGVIEEGALADLLLVDGNPLENITLIEDPQRKFLVIMKDGTIHKNLVARDTTGARESS